MLSMVNATIKSIMPDGKTTELYLSFSCVLKLKKDPKNVEPEVP